MQFAFIFWETVSVTSSGMTWRYPQKVFLRIPPSSWQRGPFESRRAFVSIDSHGRISLCSPAGSAIPQPARFPLRPEQT
jgi:hypothetical protein